MKKMFNFYYNKLCKIFYNYQINLLSKLKVVRVYKNNNLFPHGNTIFFKNFFLKKKYYNVINPFSLYQYSYLTYILLTSKTFKILTKGYFISIKIFIKNFFFKFLFIYKTSIGEGFIYVRGLLLICFLDACITDDEPLWEPLEWSLVQTWIFFIFIFAWIGENLIVSRYGSYTGRDKRVWFAWYKTFWLLDFWFLISFAAAALFVIVPFYYELTYSIAFVFSWWDWYSRVFFFKFISIYTIILLIAHLLLINVRWLNWKKLIFLTLIINFFLVYLLYTHFITSFFCYFTDPLWYQKTRFVDYIQLSHEPLKWGWGSSKRDHFSYHKVSTSLWFKNDGPFASAFLILNLFFFLSLFFLYIYWLTLLRRAYVTKEFTFTFTTYCVSALRQFFYFFLLLYIFIFISFITNYWRFPIEFLWTLNSDSWLCNFFNILKDYTSFLIFIFKL